MIPAGAASGMKSFDAFAFVEKLAGTGGSAGSVTLTFKSDSPGKVFFTKLLYKRIHRNIYIWKTLNPLYLV